MARYQHLEIFKAAYDLLGMIVDLTANLPRPMKPTLGMRMQQLCTKITLKISKANSASDKAPHLDRLLTQKEELEILLRVCVDKRFISKPQYANAIELTSSVGKQANGWRRYASPAEETTTIWLLFWYIPGHDKPNRQYQAWRTRHADLCALEVHDAALLREVSDQPQVLRGARHCRMSTMASVRGLPDGHGGMPESGHDARPEGQQSGLRTRELPLGDEGRTESKPPFPRRPIDAQRRDSERNRLGPRHWHYAEHAPPAAGCQLAAGPRSECGTIWRCDAESSPALGATDPRRSDQDRPAVGCRLRHYAERSTHAHTSRLAVGSRPETERAQSHLSRSLPATDLHVAANSYLGTCRQASKSWTDRRRLERIALRRDRAVDLKLTKTYRPSVEVEAS